MWMAMLMQEFGTPLQDAERRDFTINSLFYNISEHRVEDFTGRVRALVYPLLFVCGHCLMDFF